MAIIKKTITEKPTPEQLKAANVAWTPENDKKVKNKNKKTGK